MTNGNRLKLNRALEFYNAKDCRASRTIRHSRLRVRTSPGRRDATAHEDGSCIQAPAQGRPQFKQSFPVASHAPLRSRTAQSHIARAQDGDVSDAAIQDGSDGTLWGHADASRPRLLIPQCHQVQDQIVAREEDIGTRLADKSGAAGPPQIAPPCGGPFSRPANPSGTSTGCQDSVMSRTTTAAFAPSTSDRHVDNVD